MPRVQFDETDFLRGKIVAPNWYVVRVDNCEEKLSKDGGSTNYVMEGTIMQGADGSHDYDGVPIVWNFNSKAKGFIIGYLQALGVDPKPGQGINLEASIGKTLQIYVENKTYEGRILNNVNHKYKPAE
jgi:hypothetical protein